jgi:hypothetical protein
MDAAEPAVNDLSQATAGPQELPVCGLCIKSISSKSAVKCATCQVSCHVSCIVAKFVASGGKECKHSKEWLGEFLNAGPFYYSCNTCLVKNLNKSSGDIAAVKTAPNAEVQHCSDVALLHQEVAGMKASFTAMSGDMNQMMKRVSELQSSLSLYATLPMPVSSGQTKQDEDKPDKSQPASTQQRSYASLFSSKSLTETVKEAVTASLKQQSSMTRDKASVVIYGLSERKQDCSDVGSILRAMSVNCSPIDGFRLGKVQSDSATSRPRPLKVIFNSEHDKYMVLRAARHLKDNHAFRNVRISKYLSSEERTKLKATRAECDKLNEDAGCHSSPKQYIVIDSGIKVRGSDGKLKDYKPRAAIENSATTVVSEPKNGVAGSQAAPST